MSVYPMDDEIEVDPFPTSTPKASHENTSHPYSLSSPHAADQQEKQRRAEIWGFDPEEGTPDKRRRSPSPTTTTTTRNQTKQQEVRSWERREEREKTPPRPAPRKQTWPPEDASDQSAKFVDTGRESRLSIKDKVKQMEVVDHQQQQQEDIPVKYVTERKTSIQERIQKLKSDNREDDPPPKTRASPPRRIGRIDAPSALSRYQEQLQEQEEADEKRIESAGKYKESEEEEQESRVKETFKKEQVNMTSLAPPGSSSSSSSSSTDPEVREQYHQVITI